MTSWWTFLDHWQIKSRPSNSTWLTCFRSDRAIQFDRRQKKKRYTHMTCYVLNYTSPRERAFFSLTHFLIWFPLKHRLSFELNSETRGRLQRTIYLTLREQRSWRNYQRRIGLHLRVLMQAIASPRFFMHHPLWVSKSEVPFVLIVVQPRDKLGQTMTLYGYMPCLLLGVNGRMSRLISPLGFSFASRGVTKDWCSNIKRECKFQQEDI